MVTRLDRYVGDIFQELKKQELDQNTIVIFTSDNGPHQESGFNPEFFNSNSNLRGSKRYLYEGGIRVPLLIWGPGIVKKSIVSNHISYFPDIFSTIADITKVDLKNSNDGVSFLPTLISTPNKQKTHQYLYWEYHENKGAQAVRTGDWKSVTQPYGGTAKLYNLKDDISESKNIASQHPEILLQHKKIMDEAHSDLPPIENFRVFLAREKLLNKKLVVFTGSIVAAIAIFLFIMRMQLQKSPTRKQEF